MFKIGERVKVVGSLNPEYNSVIGIIDYDYSGLYKIKTENFHQEHVTFEGFKLELCPVKEENEI